MNPGSSNARSAQRRLEIRSFLIWLCAAALLPPGCSLWVSSELADKPVEVDGGRGGAGGQGGAGSGGDSQSGNQSSGAGPSSSSGAPICKEGRADCDGSEANGCEATLSNDDENCGQCHHQCTKGDNCKEGKCK